MLRTIGMGRGQVTGLVFLEACFLGVIGALLGVGLGILLARIGGLDQPHPQPGSGQDRNTANCNGDQRGGGGLVVTLLAAGIPALQAGRISPMEALRIRAKADQSWLIRQGWILGLVLLVVSTVLLVGKSIPLRCSIPFGKYDGFWPF